MTIYQIFTRLYGNQNSSNIVSGTFAENGAAKFNDFTSHRLLRIKDMGFSHVWFTGVIEHATHTDYSEFGIANDHPQVVKGKAGSPYAIKDYYDVDPDLAVDVPRRMQEFEALIARTHKAGLKLIIDFVPNHVARQYKSDAAPKGVADLGANEQTHLHFSPQNNFYYCWDQNFNAAQLPALNGAKAPYEEVPARATGNDQFTAAPSANDWYETIKLNYGVDYCGGGAKHFYPIPNTWRQMLDILLFWASKGIDAFRCDMAEMVPVEFWHFAIAAVKRQYPHLHFIAEVYNPALYRSYIYDGGFDYLYDKVGFYDTLRGVINQHTPSSAITQAWQSTDDIRQNMLYFLENHDEQRIASDFFCGDAQKALPALAVLALMGNNPLMIYAGQELGEKGMEAEGFSGCDGRTTIFDYWSPASLRKLAAMPKGKATLRQLSGGGVLSPEEKNLYNAHRDLIRLREEHHAIREGHFYDLMYVNHGGLEGFNDSRHYAFLRHHKDELLLIVANFSDQQAEMGILIPAHAFNFLSLKEGEFTARELISQKPLNISLSKDGFTHVSVLPHSYIVVSIIQN